MAFKPDLLDALNDNTPVPWYRRPFHLPGPKELGWSTTGALGSRLWTPFQEGKTWEDWEEHIQRTYPYRYFVVVTVPRIFRPLWRACDRFGYWLKCHLLRSYRFHLLDLRGVDPLSDYTHGYMDPCQTMYLAGWAALRSYIEKEQPENPASLATPEQLQEEHFIDWQSAYDEAVALHRWWTIERAQEENESEKLYAVVRAAAETRNRALYEEASKTWLAYRNKLEEKEQEQFLRLAKIRPRLWT